MPEEIVKKYRHLYEKSNYIQLHNILKSPPSKSSSILVKAFGVGEPDDFPDHFINVKVEKHKDEYLGVTTITKYGKKVHAKVSVDHQITNWEKRRMKIYLAYEWIHVVLHFCQRGFGKTRYTVKKEVNILISWLAESTKHCAIHLSDFHQKMHKALRKLLVSEYALEQTLIRISIEKSNDIVSLGELEKFMQNDYTQAYEKITWPLIQQFSEEWDIEQNIVESRLQEVFGLS